jgi:hypothetical protein
MSSAGAFGAPGVAWRRLAKALLATYAFWLLGAALLALPVVQAVSASHVLDFPEGDSLLLESGGLYLLEVFLHEREAIAAALPATLLLALLVASAGIVPQWLVVRALGPSAARARRALGSCLAIGVATWGARVALGLATLLVAMTVRSYVAGMRDERAPFVALASTALIGLGVQALVSVAHDAAVLEAIVRGAGARQAVIDALGQLRRRGAGWIARYAAFALAALGIALGGAIAVSELDVRWSGAWLTSLLLHQLAIALTIALRAAWLWSLRRDLGVSADGSAGNTAEERLPPAQADAFL